MRSRRANGFLKLSLLSIALPGLGGCGGAVDAQDEFATTAQAVTTRMGVDYSFARPSPTGLKSAGYTFALRYLSYDNSSTHGKILTASEASALKAAGVDVVSNWEYAADDALDGLSAGKSDATAALNQATAAGMPAGRPIYFSVDFDATEAQQATINAYFDGVTAVLGHSRVGAYAGYYVIKRLFDAGKIAWGWQTYAWSGGQWDTRAQLRQTHNGVTIAGGSCDIDQSEADDFGQWSGSGGGGGGGGGGSSDCSVHSDHKLYCTNSTGAAMHALATASSVVVNILRSSTSWFDCWGTGDLHAGGNTTWYHTLGDDNSTYGWVPGVDLSTPDAFDENPSAYGLAKCAALPSSCSVHADGKLYCNNTSGAAIYASATTASSVVNHLRTTTSWFDCWGIGQLHAGGNTTWYHTIGDDNGNWGYVPAVSLSTTSAFDANPSYSGLHKCGE